MLVSSSDCDIGEVRLARLLLGVLGELLCKELDIFDYVTSGTWTEQRFPLWCFEAFSFWSYRLAGEAAIITHSLSAEVEVIRWQAIGSSGNSRSLIFAWF